MNTWEPISDASAWRGADLEANRNWEFRLTDNHRAELKSALATVTRRGLDISAITADDFPLPTLVETLRKIATELKSGTGFSLLHGFPVDDFDYPDLEKMYWGLCSHLGSGVTQNGDGGLIHYVTDGKLRPNQGTRGVGHPIEVPLHIDLTDIASLLCIQQAPDEPPSRVGSSSTLFNEVLARRPALLERLFKGFEWDRMEEHGADETPSSGYRVPFFSMADGHLSCRYNRHWIVSALKRVNGQVNEADNELFDFIDRLGAEHCFEFPFQRGDIQFVNNYIVMHGRAAHAIVAEETRKRVLLRIWLETPDFRPVADEAIVRFGIGYHGKLGWSAGDVRKGRAGNARPRRADGALQLND
jgi:hypothetical protein